MQNNITRTNTKMVVSTTGLLHPVPLAPEDEGSRELTCYIRDGKDEEVACFIAAGACQFKRPLIKEGYKPLHCSAVFGQISTLQLLLEHKANPNERVAEKRQLTALHLAAQKGYQDCVKILLRYKADPNATLQPTDTPHPSDEPQAFYPPRLRYTPLDWAIIENKIAVVEILLCSVILVRQGDHSPVVIATRNPNATILFLLFVSVSEMVQS